MFGGEGERQERGADTDDVQQLRQLLGDRVERQSREGNRRIDPTVSAGPREPVAENATPPAEQPQPGIPDDTQQNERGHRLPPTPDTRIEREKAEIQTDEPVIRNGGHLVK